MIRINESEILYTSKSASDEDKFFIDNELVNGYIKVRELQNFKLVHRNLKFKKDVEVQYAHSNHGMLFEYIINADGTKHMTDKDELVVQSATTNVYEESSLTNQNLTNRTQFKAGSTYKTLGIKPHNDLLEKLHKKNYSFSTLLCEETRYKISEYVIIRNLLDLDATITAEKIVALFESTEFIDELADALCLEFIIYILKSENKEFESIVKIENAIKSLLPNKITAEEVSKRLNISKRTLNTICSEHGWTFLELKKVVISTKYNQLKKLGLPDEYICKNLGYSTATYMHKALKDI